MQFVIIAADPQGDAAQVRVDRVIKAGKLSRVGVGIEIVLNAVQQKLQYH